MGYRTGSHRHALVGGIVAAMVVALIATPVALARVVRNTIDPVAAVSDNGRHLVVTGPIECTPGERAYIRLVVTQRGTGAVADGITRVVCDGTAQQWRIEAGAQGRERFEPGPAIAVASARTATRGHSTDAHQWLVELTLRDD
jgi:hypothetical protein